MVWDQGVGDSIGRTRPLHQAGPRTYDEALGLERQISDLVNEAYGLTPEDIALMWQTAPPRMPFSAG
jgi:hypothetical protein